MPKKPKNLGDRTPVTGGIALPKRMSAIPRDDDAAPTDDLGQQAYWLLKLHPDKVALNFRKSDLSGMDDATKKLLIADIQHALGVVPFKADVL